jgi:hypothetical protein
MVSSRSSRAGCEQRLVVPQPSRHSLGLLSPCHAIASESIPSEPPAGHPDAELRCPSDRKFRRYRGAIWMSKDAVFAVFSLGWTQCHPGPGSIPTDRLRALIELTYPCIAGVHTVHGRVVVGHTDLMDAVSVRRSAAARRAVGLTLFEYAAGFLH